MNEREAPRLLEGACTEGAETSAGLLVRRIRRVLALWLVLVLQGGGPLARGADEDGQLWNAVTATGRFQEGGRTRHWLEAQARFGEDATRLGQTLLRAGLGIDATPGASAWLGYAHIHTEPAGAARNRTEHRLWQQWLWSPRRSLLGFEVLSRSRLEQRRLEDFDDTGWRARQFLRLARPLDGQRRWSLVLWDELFVHLDDTDWGADRGLDQNRAFAGLARQLGPALRLEAGYLNQYTRRAERADALGHTLSLALFVTR